MWFYLIRSVIVLTILKLCFASEYIDSAIRESNEVDLNETFFASLEDYHVNATPALESTYPWIARVIHSRSNDGPHLCTAICIDAGILITAARCIYNLKVNYTSVIFNSQRMSIRAFVFPSRHTSQHYDDIGFIIVDNVYEGSWKVVKMYQGKRTDKAFGWFSKINFTGAKFKVVGYASSRALHKFKAPDRQYNLTELPIVIGIDICSTILTFFHQISGFRVPCYHSCTVREFKQDKPPCSRYHGVEGGAIINVKDNRLFGVATWGPFFQNYDLPVGFSVVNSDSFFEDFKCAKVIRDARVMRTYQYLCEKNGY